MRRLLALLLLLLAATPVARAAELSPRQRALLLLRVLVYDRALLQRAGGSVVVGVVFSPDGDPAEHEALLATFEELSRTVKAAGLPVLAVAMPYLGPSAFAGQLAKVRPVAVYACAGLGAAAPEVAAAARKARVLAVGGERRLVVGSGFAVALIDRGDRAGLVIDPQAAAAAGADFDSALLSIADLVGWKDPADDRP